MPRFLTVLLILAAVLPTVADSATCARDPVPAATLLFPFVVLDYNEGTTGLSTEIAITNTSASAQIAHVTLWSDIGVPVLGFNIVLSGYDVQRFDLREVLVDGVLPDTGTASPYVVSGAAVPDGPMSPGTALAQPQGTDTIYDRCNPVDHQGYPDFPPLPQASLDVMRQMLQYSQTWTRGQLDCDDWHIMGVANPYTIGNWFEGRSTADPTWMYITVDVVWTCCRMFGSTSENYWVDGPGNNPSWEEDGAQRMLSNVLMGDTVYTDLDAGISESAPAVHIEADADLADFARPLSPLAGHPVSFYTRYAWMNWSREDYREPLPTAWAVRYHYEVADGVETHLRVWTGSTMFNDLQHLVTDDANEILGAFDCTPYTYYAWDEDEQVVAGAGDPYNRLPLATQEVSVEEFQTPWNRGWLLFVWPYSNATSLSIPDYAEVLDYSQVWMTGVTTMQEAGFSHRFRLPATVWGDYNCQVPPKGDVDLNGIVETADLAALLDVLFDGGTAANADVNEDLAIDAADLAALVQIVAP